MYPHDTIVATATPPGTGGLSVVRISGAASTEIAARMLGSLPAPRHATVSTFVNADGEPLDNGIALYFSAPDSFTGEHVLELHAHGGPVVCESLVSAAIELGARRAEPGEFSKRAFLNDKIDLAQAEAIADLISSATSQAARAALRTLTGAFSAAVDALQEQLLRVRLHVEAAIDFPEEEIDFLSDSELSQRLKECGEAFELLQNQARVGRVLRQGYQMVIVGRPNAGKSSLLNLLSGEESAIVTEVAGTTRDIIRERINLDGLAVELIDTAGIRDNPDQIEAEGIRRAREALKNTDAALWIQDATAGTEPMVEGIQEDMPVDAAVIVIRNKADISGDRPGLSQEEPPVINLSAKTGAGLDTLKSEIRKLAGYRDLGEGAFTARKRHLEALDKAANHFARGLNALEEEKAGELLAEELRLAHLALAEITGEFSSDDLLGKIFSEFCIGK